MPSVRSLLNETIQTSPVDACAETPFGKALREVCAWLNETYGAFLSASLKDSSTPQVQHLMIWPKGRRNERTILFSAYMTETSAQILANDSPTFVHTDGFVQHIAYILKRPSFHRILSTFKELATEPIAGVLRVGANRSVTLLADIQVEIPIKEQHRLADASESNPPIPKIEGLMVTIKKGQYSRNRQPNWLIAGGYLLNIDDVCPETENRLRITGMPVPAVDLD